MTIGDSTYVPIVTIADLDAFEAEHPGYVVAATRAAFVKAIGAFKHYAVSFGRGDGGSYILVHEPDGAPPPSGTPDPAVERILHQARKELGALQSQAVRSAAKAERDARARAQVADPQLFEELAAARAAFNED